MHSICEMRAVSIIWLENVGLPIYSQWEATNRTLVGVVGWWQRPGPRCQTTGCTFPKCVTGDSSLPQASVLPSVRGEVGTEDLRSFPALKYNHFMTH